MQKKEFQIENSIYDESSIKKSIEDFDWFDISYIEGKLSISWDNENEIDEVFNEFMNYVLWMQNEII